MSYRPRHQPQLGRGTVVPGRTRGSRDCGPRSWQMGIDQRTQGQLRPSVSALRKRGKVQGPQATNVWDAKRAVESYKSIRGRRALRYDILRSIDAVKMHLSKGRPVHLCIHFGKWNQVANRTGDPNFTGGHSVLVAAQRRKRDGTWQWLLYDPLEDARRGSIPRGPRWVTRWRLIRAAEAFAGGKGKCYAGAFRGGQKT